MKRLALAVGALLALTSVAFGQATVVPPSLSGQECWAVGQGPNGPGNFICINQVRNTTGYQLLAAASGTITTTSNVNSLLVNAQPAAGTAFTTPANPISDGQVFQLCNVTAAAWSTNASTLVAASGQSINGGTITTTILGAHLCVELVYQLSNTTWYQIR